MSCKKRVVLYSSIGSTAASEVSQGGWTKTLSTLVARSEIPPFRYAYKMSIQKCNTIYIGGGNRMIYKYIPSILGLHQHIHCAACVHMPMRNTFHMFERSVPTPKRLRSSCNHRGSRPENFSVTNFTTGGQHGFFWMFPKIVVPQNHPFL